jgi:hypothetical protein
VKTHLFVAASAFVLTLPAFAGEEVRIEKSVKCTTTENGNEKKTICTTDGQGPGPTWHQKDGPQVHVVPGGEQNVDVQVFNHGDGKGENRIVIVRRHSMDNADANKDGKVSRKEFLARAEKHFAEMDKNGNGSLEGDEMHPPMPPMPPGVPPLPPVPPVPPVPPAPPVQN